MTLQDKTRNLDERTIAGFGDEWARFDQSAVDQAELQRIFELYFEIFPWDRLPANAVGFDLGCGSGRWAARVAKRVGTLHCIDASAAALNVARRNLAALSNCRLHHASVDALPIADGSMDFGYSLGVLHHVPDTQAGIEACVAKLKPGAPFLIYLYYAFDNKPAWFRVAWRLTDWARRAISRLPFWAMSAVCNVLAILVYFPLARGARLLEKCGCNVAHFPLSAYRNLSFYTMCTDARDRFGTRLEQRFTAAQIVEMMTRASLRDVHVGPGLPYWCALGYKV